MKMIFCHNVFDRFITLYKNLSIEKNLFPDSISIVGYNDKHPNEEGLFNVFKNVHFLNFPGLDHKIGCTNGCIKTLQESLNHEADVIIFSHDDVYMDDKYIDIIHKNIELIKGGEYDVICRRPKKTSVLTNKYYMMEVFYISKSAVEKCFKDQPLYAIEDDIPHDVNASISPEVFLYNKANDVQDVKILELEYDITAPIVDYNKLLGEATGFFHEKIGYRGWNDKGYIGKKQY